MHGQGWVLAMQLEVPLADGQNKKVGQEGEGGAITPAPWAQRARAICRLQFLDDEDHVVLQEVHLYAQGGAGRSGTSLP